MGLFAIFFFPLVECLFEFFACIFLGCLCFVLFCFVSYLYISDIVFYQICDLQILPPSLKLIISFFYSCLLKSRHS